MLFHLVFRDNNDKRLLQLASPAVPEPSERVYIDGVAYVVVDRTWEFETPKCEGGVFGFAYLTVKRIPAARKAA